MAHFRVTVELDRAETVILAAEAHEPLTERSYGVRSGVTATA